MLHPSYSDLMKVVNSEVEPGEALVVNSRYSIVMATSKRARQIISGEEPLINAAGKKPLSVAVEELKQGKIKILTEEEAAQVRMENGDLVIDIGEPEDLEEVLEKYEYIEDIEDIGNDEDIEDIEE